MLDRLRAEQAKIKMCSRRWTIYYVTCHIEGISERMLKHYIKPVLLYGLSLEMWWAKLGRF